MLIGLTVLFADHMHTTCMQGSVEYFYSIGMVWMVKYEMIRSKMCLDCLALAITVYWATRTL